MEKYQYKIQSCFLFHTPIKIKIPEEYSDDIFNGLFKQIEEIDEKYNSHKDSSFFSRINQKAGNFVEVDENTIDMIYRTIYFSNLFNGKYDITIMPLIRLWGFYKKRRNLVPSDKKINKLQSFIDYKKVEISKNKVKIAKGQEMTTGSFLKAYAIDEVSKSMKKQGIHDGIINAGGSTIYGINCEQHPQWKVNIRHPETNELLWTIAIKNQCYSTSAQNNNSISIKGKIYGHILNPLTGFPSQNKLIGILTEDCMTGDILSTALFNETAENFLNKTRLLSQQFFIEGFLIDQSNNIIQTDGFKNFICT